MSIEDRVKDVQQRIENAAIKVGRNPKEITLVGVTKTQNAEDVRRLIKAGVTTIGENRVQEILQKEPFLQDLPHSTHLIGHLQRNKTKYLPGKINMLQSLSSVKTMQALCATFEKTGQVLDVLLEVNIGDETTKTGLDVAAVSQLAAMVCESKCLCLRGLMAIPPPAKQQQSQRYFKQMYQLFIDIRSKKMDNSNINVLSMGMSSDFEYAIYEGATMVRVGTQLFGPRENA